MVELTRVAGDDPRIRVAGERCERDAERHALTFDNQVMVVMRIAAPKPGIPCGLVLDLDGGGNSFDVLVDGKLHSTFWTNRWVSRRGRHSLVLSGGAADDGVGSVLTVTLVKRTEPKSVQLWFLFAAWPATLHSVHLSPGWDMLPPRLTPRRVEFVGDSDMAAFGVEGPPTPISLCGLLGVRDRHQNISSSWAHMLCRMLEAEPSVVAWSGVGAHQNAVMCQTPRIGEYYGRALASRPGSRFEPADATEIPGGAREMPGDAWVPQLVLVEIGANDLHGGRAPPAQADFVRAVRAAPALILGLVAAMDVPSAPEGHSSLRRHVEAAVASYVEQTGDTLVRLAVPTDLGDLSWPEDGASIEHWGASGMRKYAEAVCRHIEGLPREVGEVASWRRVAPRAGLLSGVSDT